MKRRAAGFTLIELMVTVVVLAVLATVAVVSYTKYAQRARTQEAINFLNEIKLKQETYYGTYQQYVSAGQLNDTSTWYPPGNLTTTDYLAWDIDCTNTGGDAIKDAWCSLGVRPMFQACPSGTTSASGHCTQHQFVTEGSSPTKTTPTVNTFEGSTVIRNTNADWWFAVARGDLDHDGTYSAWFLSSETPEVYNRVPDEL